MIGNGLRRLRDLLLGRKSSTTTLVPAPVRVKR